MGNILSIIIVISEINGEMISPYPDECLTPVVIFAGCVCRCTGITTMASSTPSTTTATTDVVVSASPDVMMVTGRPFLRGPPPLARPGMPRARPTSTITTATMATATGSLLSGTSYPPFASGTGMGSGTIRANPGYPWSGAWPQAQAPVRMHLGRLDQEPPELLVGSPTVDVVDDGASSEEDDDADLDFNYKKAVGLVFKLLDLPSPTPSKHQSRLLGEFTEGSKLRFPLDEDIAKSFEASWDKLTGNKLEGGFAVTGPLRSLPPAKRKKAAVKQDFYANTYQVNQGSDGLGLPLKDRKIDPDFESILGKAKLSNLDSCLDLAGLGLRIANHMIFFSDAQRHIIQGLGEHVKPEGSDIYKTLVDFNLVKNKALCHLVSVLTNLQCLSVIHKREEVLSDAKLDALEKSYLVHAPLMDKHDRLFSGCLGDFNEWRSSRKQTEVINSLIAQGRSGVAKGDRKKGGPKPFAASASVKEKISSFRSSARKDDRSRDRGSFRRRGSSNRSRSGDGGKKKSAM